MNKLPRRKFIANSVLGAVGFTAGLTKITGNKAVAGTSANVTRETYNFTRKVIVDGGYDVIVAGGGPSGAVAAISAGRLGARVLLIEGTGCMGGMGTSGLVTTFASMSDGVQCIVGGVMREIVETLYNRKQLGIDVTPDYWQKMNPSWMPYQAEGLKLLLDELAVHAGVEVRFFTRVIDADVDAKKEQVNGIILNNIEGLQYVEAKTFIDCTGDAVLSKLCGVDCREAGRDTPLPMPPTLDRLHASIDWKSMPSRSKERELYLKAIADGHFTQNYQPAGMFRVGHSVGQLNAGHVPKLDALRCKDLSDGIMLGRKIAQEYVTFYRKYVPGCENIELVCTGSLMGIRESRRIIGEYELNTDDYMARRKFPDQIGVFNSYIDIHPYELSEAALKKSRETAKFGRMGAGESFGIPYSILVPRGWRNLWVAGRCNSSDVNVHGVIRMQPACAMMGQAAGTAAVQSIQTGQAANDLNTKQLIKTLRDNGAYLPQKRLSSKMTLD